MAAFTYTAPTVGGSSDTWGTTLNQNWADLSTFLGSLDSAELAVLDGITATTAELNYVDGVTSAIQTQLDAKLVKASNLSDLTDKETARSNLGANNASNLTEGTVNSARLPSVQVAASVESATPSQGTVTVDADGSLLAYSGGEYLYTAGQRIQSNYVSEPTNQDVASGASVTRHSVTITPKSANSTFRVLCTVGVFVEQAGETNAPTVTGRIVVDSVSTARALAEVEQDGDEKWYLQLVLFCEVPSTDANMDFDVTVACSSGARKAEIIESTLSIEEISGDWV